MIHSGYKINTIVKGIAAARIGIATKEIAALTDQYNVINTGLQSKIARLHEKNASERKQKKALYAAQDLLNYYNEDCEEVTAVLADTICEDVLYLYPNELYTGGVTITLPEDVTRVQDTVVTHDIKGVERESDAYETYEKFAAAAARALSKKFLWNEDGEWGIVTIESRWTGGSKNRIIVPDDYVHAYVRVICIKGGMPVSAPVLDSVLRKMKSIRPMTLEA
jgi:hypothetical protein